ncbi:MAG: PAS domain S-box protein [Saprospiraceae bacterium]|nr:PAS domain S-box protein [Saprospiraceae bacterium]
MDNLKVLAKTLAPELVSESSSAKIERLERIIALRTTQIKGINEFAKILMHQTDVVDICWTIVDHAMSQFGIEDCIVYLFEPDKISLTPVAAYGQKKSDHRTIEAPMMLQVGEGIVGRVADSGQPVLINDTSQCDFYLKDQIIRFSELAVPLISDGEIIGVIDSEHSEKNFFDEYYLSLFTTVANLASIKIRDTLTKEKQRKTEIELIENQKKFKIIVEGAHEMIFELDKNGFFTYANPTFYERMQYTKEDLSTLHFVHLIADADREKVVNFYLAQLKERNQYAYIELPAKTKFGESLWVGQHTTFHFDHEGTLIDAITVSRDITERRKYERSLQIQEQKYRNILTNMNLGLLEVDPHDVIKFANKSFLEMSGYSSEELTGHKASELFVLEENKELVNQKNKLREKGITDIYQLQVKNKRGEPRWWLVSGAPNYNDEGEMVGSIGIHLDLSDQKIMEKQLEEALEKAKESSRSKEHFLTNMSHEIRTPLNAIIGILRDFPNTNLNKSQNQYITYVQGSALHLLSIVNNILDISKIESGDLYLDKHPFKLNDLLHETRSILQNEASRRGLILEFNYPEENRRYLGDSTRIKQILINLIGNSLKFTPKGKVTLDCKISEKSESIHALQLTVTDTGIGMESSFVSKIFTKFSQEDKTTSRQYGGTGLGMALTHELVQLMDGRITVTSIKDAGTNVKINIDLELSLEENHSYSNEDIKINQLEQLHILLAEDNKVNRLVVKMSLRSINCKITEAENGQQVLDHLKHQHFDIILMDLQMPLMDGMEATRVIRQELNSNIPIIALTANALKTAIDKCLQNGMNGYLTKPFEKSALISIIRQWTKNKWQEIPIRRVEKLPIE